MNINMTTFFTPLPSPSGACIFKLYGYSSGDERKKFNKKKKVQERDGYLPSILTVLRQTVRHTFIFFRFCA